MTVHIEPITFVIRGYSNGKDYGESFDYSLVLSKEDDIGYVRGLSGTIDMNIARELIEGARELGLFEIRYQRRLKGKLVWKKLKIK